MRKLLLSFALLFSLSSFAHENYSSMLKVGRTWHAEFSPEMGGGTETITIVGDTLIDGFLHYRMEADLKLSWGEIVLKYLLIEKDCKLYRRNYKNEETTQLIDFGQKDAAQIEEDSIKVRGRIYRRIASNKNTKIVEGIGMSFMKWTVFSQTEGTRLISCTDGDDIIFEASDFDAPSLTAEPIAESTPEYKVMLKKGRK